MHRAQKKLPSNQTLRDKHNIFLAYIRNINHGFLANKTLDKIEQDDKQITYMYQLQGARSAMLLIWYASCLVNKFIRMFILLFV